MFEVFHRFHHHYVHIWPANQPTCNRLSLIPISLHKCPTTNYLSHNSFWISSDRQMTITLSVRDQFWRRKFALPEEKRFVHGLAGMKQRWLTWPKCIKLHLLIPYKVNLIIGLICYSITYLTYTWNKEILNTWITFKHYFLHCWWHSYKKTKTTHFTHIQVFNSIKC